MKPFLLFSFLALSCVSASHARILNVPAGYSTIQGAINASVNGDTVLVAPGTYFENVIFRGKRIVLTSRYYETGDPMYIESTIINGSTPSHPDSASCVRITGGEDTTTVLQGFTLTGGYGTLWKDEHSPGRYWEGGGVLVAFSNPLIRHNIIRDNDVNRSGGAGAGGAGIRIGDSSPRVLNNIVVRNKGMYGGGIVSNYASPTIRNNIVAFNIVSQAIPGIETYGGGGIWFNGGVTGNRVENNTVVGNRSSGGGTSGAQGRGGGMIAVFGATINTRNNIVWGNTQTTGGQIGVASGSAQVSYSNVEGGFAGTGNINQNPMFADTSFYLLPGSPCIDAGDTSSTFNDPADPSNPQLAQWPSMGGLRNDMGAYGGPWRADLATILTSIRDTKMPSPLSFELRQNYPNPFNPATRIDFSIEKAGLVSLKVFDILGKEVRTVAHEEMAPGTYSMEFDATNLPSGVYYYRLVHENHTQTKKMMLIR